MHWSVSQILEFETHHTITLLNNDKGRELFVYQPQSIKTLFALDAQNILYIFFIMMDNNKDPKVNLNFIFQIVYLQICENSKPRHKFYNKIFLYFTPLGITALWGNLIFVFTMWLDFVLLTCPFADFAIGLM